MKRCFLARQSRDNHRKGDSRRYKSYDSTLSRDMRVCSLWDPWKKLDLFKLWHNNNTAILPKNLYYTTLWREEKGKEKRYLWENIRGPYNTK